MRSLHQRLLILLLLLAAPVEAATTFYLGEDPPDLYPTPDSAWNNVPTTPKWRTLVSSKDVSNLSHNGPNVYSVFTAASATAGHFSHEATFIGPPMDASISFTSGVDTVTAWARVQEAASTDNLDRCILGIRIINSAGAVQATILTLGNYGATSEFPIPSTTQTRRCANAQALTGSHTTSSGDRLVVEYGYSASTGGTTPEGRWVWGRRNSTSDCTVDLNTTGCMPFITFSNTITYTTPTVRNSSWIYTDRFFFNFDHDTQIAPGFDAAWENTAGHRRRRLDPNWNGSQLTVGAQVFLTQSVATDEYLIYQLITAPLESGIAFTTSTKVWMVASVMEPEADDDVDKCVVGIRVLDDDGSTINATLLPVATYHQSGVEFFQSSDHSDAVGYVCLDGHVLTNNYTTAAGDRVVVELGAAPDGANVTPSTRFWAGDGWGIASDGANDRVTEECPLGVQVTGASCAPWIQFSVNLPRLADPDPGPTRLYFPSSGSPGITPAVHASWDASGSLIRRAIPETKGTTALGTTQYSIGAGQEAVTMQYITPAMRTGTVFTQAHTTVTGNVRARQPAGTDDVNYVVLAVRVIDDDGSTINAELWPMNAYHRSRRAVSGTSEFSATGSSTYFTEFIAGFDTTMPGTTYATVSGDRLAIEIGAYAHTTGTTPEAVFVWGENASDCPQDRSTGGADCAPWIEFSNDIQFGEATGRNPVVIH